MAEIRSTAIVESLRGRILRGLQAGTLVPGERLQSARELVDEFCVDHRVIVAAYRELADQGLVTIRGRGGVYVESTPATRAGFPALPIPWLVGVLTEAFAQEIAAPELHEWLRRSIETVRIRVVAVSATAEQAAGLARELRDDLGLIAEGAVGHELAAKDQYTISLRRADLIVATRTQLDFATKAADELGKPLIVIDVRPDIVAGEWALLLRQEVWAIVEDAEYGELLGGLLAGTPGLQNLRILVLGRDDLSVIPDGAPTFVSHRARALLARSPVRGRLLPAARIIETESARRLFGYIVNANLEAMAGSGSRGDAPPSRS